MFWRMMFIQQIMFNFASQSKTKKKQKKIILHRFFFLIAAHNNSLIGKEELPTPKINQDKIL